MKSTAAPVLAPVVHGTPSPTLGDLAKENRLAVVDVAEALDCDVSSVWRWILKGVKIGDEQVFLRAVRVGRRRYVLRSDMDAFLSLTNPEEPLSPDRKAGADRRAKADRQAAAMGL